MRGNEKKQCLQKRTSIKVGTIVLGISVLAGGMPTVSVNALEPLTIAATAADVAVDIAIYPKEEMTNHK